MKKTIKNIGKWVKAHKWQTGVCASVLILAIGVGGIGIASANQAAKEANTKALLEMAEEDGVVSAEDIENAGDLADLGSEIETDDGTFIITQDENGNIVTTLVKDKDGNSTGAIVPSSGGNESGGGSTGGGDTPSVHTHSWTPHYATGTRTVTTPVYHAAVTERVCVSPAGTYCNTCNKLLATTDEIIHHEHGGTHSQQAVYEDRVVTPAYTENVSTQEQYQYVDYYYCECGATK